MSTHRRANWSCLPLEIHQYVFQHLYREEDLLNCALVCKAWLSPAQTRLYSRVEIKNSAQLEKFQYTMRYAPHLGKKVKQLEFNQREISYLKHPLLLEGVDMAATQPLTNSGGGSNSSAAYQISFPNTATFQNPVTGQQQQPSLYQQQQPALSQQQQLSLYERPQTSFYLQQQPPLYQEQQATLYQQQQPSYYQQQPPPYYQQQQPSYNQQQRPANYPLQHVQFPTGASNTSNLQQQQQPFYHQQHQPANYLQKHAQFPISNSYNTNLQQQHQQPASGFTALP